MDVFTQTVGGSRTQSTLVYELQTACPGAKRHQAPINLPADLIMLCRGRASGFDHVHGSRYRDSPSLVYVKFSSVKACLKISMA